MKHRPIANNWNEVSISLWQDIQEILKDEYTDPIDKNVKLVGLLYDIPDEEAYDTELNEFSEMLDGIAWLGKEPIIPQPSPAYMINGVKYNVCLNQQKIKTAQYIDFKSFNTDVPKNIHLILACLLIPEGHDYNDGYDIEKVQRDILEEMRIDHALALTRFFFLQYIGLTVSSLQSLRRILKRQMRKTRDPQMKKDLMQKMKDTEELEHMFGSLA